MRPLGEALGNVGYEAAHLLDAFLHSAVITIRALTGEFAAVEYYAQQKDRPFRLEILGVIRTAEAGGDFESLVRKKARVRPYLGWPVSRSRIVDWNLPEGTFASLIRRRGG